MRVFLDTNVLVSGLATRGLSADVVRLVMSQHELVTGEVVLDELRRVLTEKFGLPTEDAVTIDQLLRRYHVEPTSRAQLPVEVRDPDDAIVLATAIAAKADVLVTGDRDLLDVASEVASPRILKPRAFWDEVHTSE